MSGKNFAKVYWKNYWDFGQKKPTIELNTTRYQDDVRHVCDSLQTNYLSSLICYMGNCFHWET